MRNLTQRAADDIVAQRETVARDGVPNYFDDQRFGSLGASGEFIAKPWCLGDDERALRLTLAESNPHNRPGDNGRRWRPVRGLRENRPLARAG